MSKRQLKRQRRLEFIRSQIKPFVPSGTTV